MNNSNGIAGPDLIFGIDLGTSCTGVSYLNVAKGSETTKTFQRWPGCACEDKVPSKMRYEGDPSNEGNFPTPGTRPEQWGFECEQTCDVREPYVAQWFKLKLDSDDPVHRARSRQLYTDYLQCIHDHLRDHFRPSMIDGRKSWDTAILHFYFSVPATWGLETVGAFRNLIEDSAFRSRGNTKVECSLTEPKAVAIHTLSEDRFTRAGESILVVDAGGGTVDLCLLDIVNADQQELKMNEVAPVQGMEYGSIFIDRAFQEEAQSRLEMLISNASISASGFDPEAAACDMIASADFQAVKLQLGTTGFQDSDIFRVRVPGLSSSVEDKTAHISNGKMSFTMLDLRQQFDVQIEGIKSQLTIMTRHLRASTRSKAIDHVVLSGGLGKSAYVEKKIHESLSSFPALANARLHQSSEPQLSVCKGLIEHAKQSSQSSTPVIRDRSAYSIGIRCRVDASDANRDLKKLAEKYRKLQSEGQWIEDYVDWFIRWGDELIDRQPVRKKYSATFDAGLSRKWWKTNIVLVNSPEEKAPMFYGTAEGRVRMNTKMTVQLSDVSPDSVKSRAGWKKWSKEKASQVRFWVEAVKRGEEVVFQAVDYKTNMPLGSECGVNLETLAVSEPQQRPMQEAPLEGNLRFW